MSGCGSCGKRKTPAPIYGRKAPSGSPAAPPPKPTKVRFPDGQEREYPTRIEAHAARIIAGGGEIVE